jgi:hypothetical protein
MNQKATASGIATSVAKSNIERTQNIAIPLNHAVFELGGNETVEKNSGAAQVIAMQAKVKLISPLSELTASRSNRPNAIHKKEARLSLRAFSQPSLAGVAERMTPTLDSVGIGNVGTPFQRSSPVATRNSKVASIDLSDRNDSGGILCDRF